MGRATVAALALTLGAVLTGCSSSGQAGDDFRPATSGESESPSPTATPSTSDSASPSPPPGFGQQAENSFAVHPRRITVTGEGRVVADTLVDYMTARLAAFNAAEVDRGALARVARADAFNDVQSYVADLQRTKHHTVGEVWVDVRRVRIRGGTATARSCMPNSTADADRGGRIVEQNSAPAYDVHARAREVTPGTWAIVDISFDGVPGCPG